MKRKWAIGLCEGLMTQIVLSASEIIIIFLVFGWLSSNHPGEMGVEVREEGNKRNSNFNFLILVLERLLYLPTCHETDSTNSANYLFCWICGTYCGSPCHLQ